MVEISETRYIRIGIPARLNFREETGTDKIGENRGNYKSLDIYTTMDAKI